MPLKNYTNTYSFSLFTFRFLKQYAVDHGPVSDYHQHHFALLDYAITSKTVKKSRKDPERAQTDSHLLDIDEAEADGEGHVLPVLHLGQRQQGLQFCQSLVAHTLLSARPRKSRQRDGKGQFFRRVKS